ncbi:MAG: 6-phosphogluconolactonase [Prevotella sp.]|jgi:6-phosphogluconolactonase|nr:6-phosphogluconolactonase [Prevotella sp.]MCH3995357.1 6-phosphogluconolactonase [Prevotella sp.]
MNIVNSDLQKLQCHAYASPIEASRALIAHMNTQALKKTNGETYCVALSGGSTPDVLFRVWADQFSNSTPWSKFLFFWVDERCVPPSDEASNYGRFKLLLSDYVPQLEEGVNVFRIIGEASPEREALRYSKLVESRVPQIKVKDLNIPQFDMVLLGIGNEGHTSSIFPGQEHLLSVSSSYLPSIHPVTGVRRVAMTGHPMMKAKQTVFLVMGSAKAEILDRIINLKFDCPARRVMSQAFSPELIGDEKAMERIRISIS